MSMCRRRPQQVILAAIIAMTCQAESSATGLSGHRNRMISFDGSEVPLSGFHQPRRIRAADLDCDGADDIIVADPSATIGGNPQAGRAAVGYGNELLGLRPSGQFVHQNVVGVAGVAEAQDFFGSDITAADFDGDGCADLAIGVEGEPVNGFSRAGAVQVFPGSPIGLDLAADFMLPLSGAAPNGPSANHNKGRAVASVRRLTTASSLPMLAIGTLGTPWEWLPMPEASRYAAVAAHLATSRARSPSSIATPRRSAESEISPVKSWLVVISMAMASATWRSSRDTSAAVRYSQAHSASKTAEI